MKGKEHPNTFAELEKMFKSDSDCYDYLMARRFCLSKVRSKRRMGDGTRSVAVYELPKSAFCHGWYIVPPFPSVDKDVV